MLPIIESRAAAKAALGAVLVVFAAYAAVLLVYSPLLLNDYPNHIARAVALADLIYRQGRDFGSAFEYHFLFTPYVMGDLMLASMVEFLGVPAATGLWTLFVFLSLPAALMVYLRATRAAGEVQLLMLLLSVFLSTDTFFVLGFLSFRLAVALVLLALAAVESLRREWSWARFLIFIGIVLVAYLTHLTAVIFIAAAVGTTAVLRFILRRSNVVSEVYLLAPIVLVLAWHFLVSAGYRQPQDGAAEAFYWGTPLSKFNHLPWAWVRYQVHWEELLLAILAVCLWFRVLFRGRLQRADVSQLSVLEPWSISLAFLGIYIVLPATYSEAAFVDVRALPFVSLFFILGLMNLPRQGGAAVGIGRFFAFCAALILAALNLLYLGNHLRTDGAWLADYRAVIANIPRHARVLPVFTGNKQGVIRPTLHAASYAATDRAAVIPYLFSADTGAPMKYFRYHDRPYAPDEEWYVSSKHGGVDWRQAAAQYQFLLLMKPFDASRIGIKGRTVAENETAALLAIQ